MTSLKLVSSLTWTINGDGLQKIKVLTVSER